MVMPATLGVLEGLRIGGTTQLCSLRYASFRGSPRRPNGSPVRSLSARRAFARYGPIGLRTSPFVQGDIAVDTDGVLGDKPWCRGTGSNCRNEVFQPRELMCVKIRRCPLASPSSYALRTRESAARSLAATPYGYVSCANTANPSMYVSLLATSPFDTRTMSTPSKLTT